tara:strand:- start:2034 stop:2882 length:849 start_codon:yes stop_codon:yes gene_type:complete
MFGHFYNNSVRKLVVGFGTLFNEIDVKRYNADDTVKESLRVPLGYGPKEKFLVRLRQPSSIDDDVKVRMTAPRLGFELTGFAYDPTRKRNTLSKRITTGAADGVSSVRKNFAEVPYTFDFSLSVFVRHMDDGLQIIEQILPYFTPEFTVTLNLNSLAQKIDVPIVLTSVTNTAEYDGDFDSGRLINFDLNFTAKSYVYGPIKDSKIITQTITTNFFAQDFTATGGVTGASGAASRVDVGVTGPSGGDSNLVTGYSADTQIYVRGYTAGSTGGPGIDVLGNTI